MVSSEAMEEVEEGGALDAKVDECLSLPKRIVRYMKLRVLTVARAKTVSLISDTDVESALRTGVRITKYLNLSFCS